MREPTKDKSLPEALIKEIIDEDRRLDKQESGRARALMQHRWHWTLDEDNQQRITLLDYAACVGRSLSIIKAYALGYLILCDPENEGITPNEARRRAGMSSERQEVTSAVGRAAKASFRTVFETLQPEVREVERIARARAEENGTTVEEEAQQAADIVFARKRQEQQIEARWEENRKKREESRKRQHTAQYLTVEYKLAKARSYIDMAQQEATNVAFDIEERGLLIDSLKELLALVNATRSVVSGGTVPLDRGNLRAI